MIKKTFYNLPDEKRNRIVEAIMNEFASAATEKVSINRIIKAANISRGSFYQYFDDKVDLVEILIKAFIDVALNEFHEAMDESDGDIFYTYSKLFDAVTKLTNDIKQKYILKNLFKNLKANDDLISDYLINRFEGFDELKNCCKKINKENLRYKSEEYIENLSQILVQILKNAVFNVFVKDADISKVKQSFECKIEIIKTGAVINTFN